MNLEEYKSIKNIIDAILVNNNIKENVTISYGTKIGIPEELAIYHKALGWYYYISDDKNNGYYTGPYDFNALILKINNRLPLNVEEHNKIRKLFPSEKMENFYYCDNEIFKSEQEIEAYEAAHPEKKVE